jgi:hypothetical protein
MIDATPATPDETLPDRLAVNEKSPFYNEALLARGIGIRFRGEVRTDVEEYCISEGWVRVAVGTARDRRGNPITMKHMGPVEAYFLTKPPTAPDAT